MSCTTGCPTQDHSSWGECVRAKNVGTNYVDTHMQKLADKTLDLYEKARKDGIQPKSTRRRDVNRAIQISEKTGTAFQA